MQRFFRIASLASVRPGTASSLRPLATAFIAKACAGGLCGVVTVVVGLIAASSAYLFFKAEKLPRWLQLVVAITAVGMVCALVYGALN